MLQVSQQFACDIIGGFFCTGTKRQKGSKRVKNGRPILLVAGMLSTSYKIYYHGKAKGVAAVTGNRWEPEFL
jgi:hypothetical protein